MEHTLTTLALIAVNLALFLLFAYAICAQGERFEAAQRAANEAALAAAQAGTLRFNGMLYLAGKDKPVEAHYHTGTGKAYYKIGIQFRSAETGRIVATSSALAGVY